MSSAPARPVHPHTRGEHDSSTADASDICGSPPHAWGTPRASRCRRRFARFTPTRVGNTRARLNYVRATQVHPHTRGEHSDRRTPIHREHGSPPHAWGTHYRPLIQYFRLRFTPTRVGNTKCGRPSRGSRSVHPHTRGEHCPRSRKKFSRRGSPPHAWGTLTQGRRLTHHARFTPTRVGNTSIASL